MPKAIPLPDDLTNALEVAAKAAGRTPEDQAALWLETGKILCEFDRPSQAPLRAALRGERPYDDLSSAERHVYLALLQCLTFHPGGIRGIQEEHQRQGLPFVVLDDDGRVVEIQPDGTEREVLDVDSYGRGETSDPG